MADRRTPCPRGRAAPRRPGPCDPSGRAGRPLHHGRRPAVVVGEADRAGHRPERAGMATAQVRHTPEDTTHPGRLTSCPDPGFELVALAVLARSASTRPTRGATHPGLAR